MYKIPFILEKAVQKYYSLDRNKKMFSLFIGEGISYILKTDCIVEEDDTWIDKRPYYRDSELKDFIKLKRCDFLVDNANIVLVEKNICGQVIQDFYFNSDYFESFFKRKDFVYSEIDFNEREKIRVKTLRFEV